MIEFLPLLALLRDRHARLKGKLIWMLRGTEARIIFKRLVRRYIAVTGSCGKTTTSALIARLTEPFGPTKLGSKENSGLFLLRGVRKLRQRVDFFVQEISGHPAGAIDVATKSFRIDVAVVTSIGFDHRTGFRSSDADVRDAIAREKGKLVEAVAPGGFACLNFDDPRVRAMASRTEQFVVSYGVTSEDADLRAVNVKAHWPDRLRFDLVVGDNETYPVITRFVGTMMLTDILAALGVIHGFGLDLAPAIATLAQTEPVRDRMSVHQGRDGKTYILDTFKAPYWSTELLLEDLRRIGIPRLTFVLGDLSDIGNSRSANYRKLIRRIAGEVDTLVLTGKSAEHGARLNNQDLANLVVAPTTFDVARYLDNCPPGVVFLKANKTTQLALVLEQVSPAAGEAVA